MASRRDMYFSADVEADGPIPGPYSMLSFGFCVAGTFDGETFARHDPEQRTHYVELRPISDDFIPDALAVSGLDREHLRREGMAPDAAMLGAHEWVTATAGEWSPVFVAYPLSFDWMFLYWYFMRFCAKGSPFGFSRALDIKTLMAMVLGKPIAATSKSALPKALRSTRSHTHNALDDAIEQADLFANLMEKRLPPLV